VPRSYVAAWAAGYFAGFLAGLLMLRARRALTPATVGALVVAIVGCAVGAKWQYRFEQAPLELHALVRALLVSPRELFAPGNHLPLGLLTGVVAAGLWCAFLRAPWRATGDALAVWASVLIPIGRLGCLANGCCMGRACGRFALFCWRHAPDTQAYNAQVAAHLIPADAPLSLPAHPLPLYFAMASLLTLGVLLWLFRRGAPAGSLLAAFCILRPAAKLALEPLRAVPEPSALLVGIPATVLVVTTIALVVTFARWAARRREGGDFARRKQATVALLALASGLGASPGAAGGNLLSLVRHPGERVNQREVHHRGLPGLQWPVRACSR